MERLDVYTKPRCVQCDATTRRLDQKYNLTEGKDYNTIDITEDQKALIYISQELGHKSAPVVVLSDVNPETGEHTQLIEDFSGYRPDRIDVIVGRLIERTLNEGFTPQEFHDKTPAPHQPVAGRQRN